MIKQKILGFLLLGLFWIYAGDDTAETSWDNSLTGGLNVNQAGFDNWVSGGESVLAWSLNLNYRFIQNRDRSNWSNTGKLAFGTSRTGDAEMRKSADEIKFESVFTYKLGSTINPFVAVVGESQFAAGFDYSADTVVQISAFMDPGYFRESFGAGLDLREGINTRVGLSFKQTLASSYPDPYSDDPETDDVETLKSEFGAESVTGISLKLSESTRYSSKLELFSALNTFDETDVNWDNTITVKLSQHINLNVNVQLVYDKDISNKRQIKQIMALGLNYAFL